MIKIFAGTNSTQLATALPSPTDLKRTDEQIWSENTGRETSSGAMMVGDSVAEKKTFAITWGILTEVQLNTIRTKMPRGFFTFKVTSTGSNSSEQVLANIEAYRSNIESEYLGILDGTVYYKSASVEVIER